MWTFFYYVCVKFRLIRYKFIIIYVSLMSHVGGKTSISDHRELKGAGAADQFPVSRYSLMVFKVRSDSEATSGS